MGDFNWRGRDLRIVSGEHKPVPLILKDRIVEALALDGHRAVLDELRLHVLVLDVDSLVDLLGGRRNDHHLIIYCLALVYRFIVKHDVGFGACFIPGGKGEVNLAGTRF